MANCGYVNCTCGPCFEIALCGKSAGEKHKPEHHLCWECEQAGCDPSGLFSCGWQEAPGGTANDNVEPVP